MRKCLDESDPIIICDYLD